MRAGFVIDEVPGSDEYTWALLNGRGKTLARAPHGYDTVEDAQVDIAAVKMAAREHEVPTKAETCDD